MARPWNIPIAYAYDADIHCESCSIRRYGIDGPGRPWVRENAVDREGNPVHPVFPDDAPWTYSPDGSHRLWCGTCGECIETHEAHD